MARVFVFVAFILLQSRFTNEKAIEPLLRRVGGETAVEEPTWFCIHRLKAEKVWKTLKSPGYPNSLDMKHSRCTWKISAPGKMSIRLAFRGIGLSASDAAHCSSNYLEIIDEELGKSQARLCGRKTAGDFVSKGNKVRMDLQRDPSDMYQRGFLLSYMATKVKPGFYAKKTFNEKPLPPLKRPKEDETPNANKKAKDRQKTTKSSNKEEAGNYIISSDGLLVQANRNSRESDNSGFKKLNGGEGGNGLSTLAIIGIVIGALIGLLIIILIVRKMFKKNRKDKDEEVVQTNSGLPKINMTQDKVINAKRNILSPNVIVRRQDGHIVPPVTEPPSKPDFKRSSHRSDTEDSGPLPDYRKISKVGLRDHHDHDSKAVSRNASRKQETTRYADGIANKTYEEDVPRRGARLQHFASRHGRDRRSAKRRSSHATSAAKKVPYRYNTHRNHGLDQKKAIEALNNEKFCEYGSVYNSQAQQQAKPAVPKRQSRLFEHREQNTESRRPKTEKRSIQGEISASESGHSNTISPEFPKRKSKPLNAPLNRENELLGSHHRDERSKNCLRSGRSRTWDVGGKSRVNLPTSFPAKRRKTIAESDERSVRKTEQQKGQSKKESKLLDKKDYKLDGIVKTKSRFECDIPSPNLPRHVVPASRG